MSLFSFRPSTAVWRNTVAAAALCAFSWSTQAAQIFDSLSGQRNYDQTFVPTNNPAIAELGDIITFGGTARSLTDVNIGLTQADFTGVAPYNVDVTLSLYNVDNLLNTSLIADRTVTIIVPSKGIFEVPFDFSGLSVPNTIYYGVSLSSTQGNAADLRLGLWDYYGTGPGLNGDGQSLPVGTDPGTVVNSATSINTVVYGRLQNSPNVLRASTNNGLGNNQLSNGFTPAVEFNAIVAVPEPETYALLLAGLLVVGSTARRRAPR